MTGTFFKRLLAFVLDILIVSLVVTLLSYVPFLNPNRDAYSEKYNELVNVYEQVEKNLASAARIYYNRHKEEDVSLIISEDLLSEGYLNEAKLSVKDDLCSGYVIVANNTFTPYIACANYETEGY